MSRVDRINSAVDACSDVFTHLVATLAVPVADGVVAVLAAENMAHVLGFSWPVSIMTGVALEGVGIVTSKAALECHLFNQERGDKPPVLEWLAWTVATVQFAVGFALILVNAVLVDRMVLGLLCIGVLSATGTLAHMLRDDVRARANAQVPGATPKQTQNGHETDTPSIAQPGARERIMAYFVENPHAPTAQAARELGMVRQTVGNWRERLVAEGAIPQNGTGHER